MPAHGAPPTASVRRLEAAAYQCCAARRWYELAGIGRSGAIGRQRDDTIGVGRRDARRELRPVRPRHRAPRHRLAGEPPLVVCGAGRPIPGPAASFLLLPWLGQLRLPSRRDIPIILSVGLFQLTFFFTLANIGLFYLPAGRSAVLAYTTALWLGAPPPPPPAHMARRRC